MNTIVRDVIPLLKSPEWAGYAFEQNLLVAPLTIESPTAAISVPIVAYCIDQTKSVAFLPASESNKQKLPDIHAAALASLRSRLCNLDWGWIDGSDGGGDILAFADDFNAAECLLLPERMLEAHALLDSPRLLACTPKRGALLVCRYRAENKDATEAFLNLCHEIYYVVDDESISPIVWGVSEGQIKDRMQIGEDSLDYLKSKYSPEASQPSEALEKASDEQKITGSKVQAEKAFLYSPGQIAFMTLFGTILAGLYGIFRNYQTQGAASAARLTVVVGCALVPLSIFTFLILPGSGYDRLFPVLSAILVGGVCKLAQGRLLKEAQASGASFHKVGNQCLVIVISLLVMLPLVAMLIMLVPSS